MMKAIRSDDRLNMSHSLNSTQDSEKDAISCASLTIEPTPVLHYKAPTSNVSSNNNNRRFSLKRPGAAVINRIDTSDHNDVLINGALFDAQLFHSARSHILDYADTPPDVNRFVQGHNMSSSSLLDPHLFKLTFILTLSEWRAGKELLLDYYPHRKNDAEILEEISYYKRFCFPELHAKQSDNGDPIDDSATFIFTRILSAGQVEYGYCRRLPLAHNQISHLPLVICIVSTYSCFKLYDAILTELTSAYMSNELECSLLMQAFYSKPIPIPTPNSSGIVCILNNRRVFFYVCPRDDRLNHDYFSTLLSCLSSQNISLLFEAMLRSKRILCFSRLPSKLTKCCLALSLLLHPFIWPYSFVSLMPSSWLHDLLDSPCPYIYGCLHETMSKLPSNIDGDTLRVDLDGNTVEGNQNDGFVLPLDLKQTLQLSLEYLTRFRLIKINSTLINIAVSEACLRVFVELFYRLPDLFKRDIIIKKKDHPCSSENLTRHDSGIDLQSLTSIDIPQSTAESSSSNRLGYEFRSDEFLIAQPCSSYVTFLNDFIHGMIFLKFLDDYQQSDDPTKPQSPTFSLFSQRLNERRRMTHDDLSINAVTRFRQTCDMLEKQLKQASRSSSTPIFSRFVKKFLE